MLENDILYSAVENLKKLVQVPINIAESKDSNIDAVLRIGNEAAYFVEVKREIHKSNLPNILEQLSRLLIDFPLLVAKSISKSAKEILQRKNISYLDMAGNCFIKNDEGLYIQIEGRKLLAGEGKRKLAAFNKNGIKLIYALLLDEDLLNQSYSVIANTANISKSTVGGILNDLKEQNFLIQLNAKTKKLNNKNALKDKWVNAYHEKLKPSLFRGKFRFVPGKISGWKKMKLGKNTFWGGEPAADILTDFLSPGEWIIYSNLGKNEFIKTLHLVPDPTEGNVSVYGTFWNEEIDDFVDASKHIVNSLLVYADLMGTHDNRNFETAIKIYEQYLSTYFAE